MTEMARNPVGDNELPEMQFSLPPLLTDSWVEQVAHDQQCAQEVGSLVFEQTFSQEPVPSIRPYAEPEWENVRHIALRCTKCGQKGGDILAMQSDPIEQVIKNVVVDFFNRQLEVIDAEQLGRDQD